MINTKFVTPDDKGLNLLFLGAHCDDIEIGCGGTILKWIKEYEIEKITWIIFTSNEKRKSEAWSSVNEILKPTIKKDIKIFNYKDGYLPNAWSSVKDKFENLKVHINPDIIFTHYRDDLHQDHRVISELTWNTFRNHVIFEYEIAKYDGDLGNPNFYITLNKNQIQKKNELLLRNFETQTKKHWFDDSLFSAVMRIRGVESASVSGYAEAFYNRKMVM